MYPSKKKLFTTTDNRLFSVQYLLVLGLGLQTTQSQSSVFASENNFVSDNSFANVFGQAAPGRLISSLLFQILKKIVYFSGDIAYDKFRSWADLGK